MTHDIAYLKRPALPETMRVSYELFPPKQTQDLSPLQDVVETLMSLDPAGFSVTCGAGGDGGTGTDDVTAWLRYQQQRPVSPHVTCAGRSRTELQELAADYAQKGIRSIVALRGDGEAGPDGLRYAHDLIALFRAIAPFDIAVGAYPEGHPDSVSLEDDLDWLMRKQDAGASCAITQYCFETDTVLRFRDAMVRRGISLDLCVGIMPIHDFAAIQRFSARCGASIPDWLAQSFRGVSGDSTLSHALSASIATQQMQWLAQEGLGRFHLYTLNKADLSLSIHHLLALPDHDRRAA